MFLSLVIIVLLVQVIQIGFEFLAKKIDKKNKRRDEMKRIYVVLSLLFVSLF